MTVMRVSAKSIATLAHDNTIAGNFIFQKCGFGSDFWEIKLTVFSSTSLSSAKYSGRGCTSTGSEPNTSHLWVNSAEYLFQHSVKRTAQMLIKRAKKMVASLSKRFFSCDI